MVSHLLTRSCALCVCSCHARLPALQLERYREIREAAEAEARRLHDEQVARAREEVRQLVEQNRPRVEHREQLLQEKEDRRRQREREVAEEEMRRIELLNKLAAQV